MTMTEVAAEARDRRSGDDMVRPAVFDGARSVFRCVERLNIEKVSEVRP